MSEALYCFPGTISPFSITNYILVRSVKYFSNSSLRDIHLQDHRDLYNGGFYNVASPSEKTSRPPIEFKYGSAGSFLATYK
jgi:hypothetical protein